MMILIYITMTMSIPRRKMPKWYTLFHSPEQVWLRGAVGAARKTLVDRLGSSKGSFWGRTTIRNGDAIYITLREFPLVVAADTSHEGGHRLVGTPGLLLEITHAECCTLAEVRVKDALGEQLKEVQRLEVSN
jgi:hypothetical protein